MTKKRQTIEVIEVSGACFSAASVGRTHIRFRVR